MINNELNVLSDERLWCGCVRSVPPRGVDSSAASPPSHALRLREPVTGHWRSVVTTTGMSGSPGDEETGAHLIPVARGLEGLLRSVTSVRRFVVPCRQVTSGGNWRG